MAFINRGGNGGIEAPLTKEKRTRASGARRFGARVLQGACGGSGSVGSCCQARRGRLLSWQSRTRGRAACRVFSTHAWRACRRGRAPGRGMVAWRGAVAWRGRAAPGLACRGERWARVGRKGRGGSVGVLAARLVERSEGRRERTERRRLAGSREQGATARSRGQGSCLLGS
jgi:hypothetical protein